MFGACLPPRGNSDIFFAKAASREQRAERRKRRFSPKPFLHFFLLARGGRDQGFQGPGAARFAAQGRWILTRGQRLVKLRVSGPGGQDPLCICSGSVRRPLDAAREPSRNFFGFLRAPLGPPGPPKSSRGSFLRYSERILRATEAPAQPDLMHRAEGF